MKISFPDDNWSNFLPRVTKLNTHIAHTKRLPGIVFRLDQVNIKVTGGHFLKVTGGHFEKCDNSSSFVARVTKFDTYIVQAKSFSFI